MITQDTDEISLHARHCQRMADSTVNELDKKRWQMLADKWWRMLDSLMQGRSGGGHPSPS